MNRWVVAGLALAVALALVVTGAAASSPFAGSLPGEVGGIGLVLLVLALVRWPTALAPSMVLLAVPWGVAMAEGGRPVVSVGVGAALLAVGELAGWSVDRRTVVPEPAAVARRTAVRIVAVVAAGVGASTVLLAVSALPAPGSLLRLLVGLAAVVGLMALLTLRRWEA